MFKYGCPSAVVLVSEGAKYPSPYFPVFSPNTGKYEPEKATYLDTFPAVGIIQ